MEAKIINLNDWEQFGGGGNGWSYYHKSDSGIMLKLNKEEIGEEKTLTEYSKSKALYDLGIDTPEVIDFVTDGRRFGMTMKRIKGKKSYAKMISEDPSRLEELAKSFAHKSKEFHSVVCDTTMFPSFYEQAKTSIEASDRIPQKIKRQVIGYLDSFDKNEFCLHGDFNPGNIIRAEDGKDYWIDLGDFSYGDPDCDLMTLLFLSSVTPAKVVEYLFHISREQCSEFLEIYGREYYGDRWHSPELEEKMRKIKMVKAALSIARHPESSLLFMPYLKGQRVKMAAIMWLADHLMTKFN